MKLLTDLRKLFFEFFTFADFFYWFVLMVLWVNILHFSFGIFIILWIVTNLLDCLIHPAAKDIRKKYGLKGPYDDEKEEDE